MRPDKTQAHYLSSTGSYRDHPRPGAESLPTVHANKNSQSTRHRSEANGQSSSMSSHAPHTRSLTDLGIRIADSRSRGGDRRGWSRRLICIDKRAEAQGTKDG